MNCPKCKSHNKVKNGLIKGVQRYRCKHCGCNYTLSSRHLSEKEAKQHLAFSLYSQGRSYHSISRILGVSHVSVINWVRKHDAESLLILLALIPYLLQYIIILTIN